MTSKRLTAAILRESPEGAERVAAALHATGNNWTQAAARLGITFRQFRYLMKVNGAAVNEQLANDQELLR